MFRKILKRKYIIASVIFVVWIAFFDQNSLLSWYKTRSDLSALEQNRDFYKAEIENLKRENRELFGDIRNLEKFGREKFFMKKSGEDLYIIERKN
jgi:cell division protein FtsB